MSLLRRLIGRPGRGGPAGRRTVLPRRRASWEQAWHTFPGSVDGVPAAWSVDLGAVDAAPLSGLDVRLEIETDYPPGPDGLPAEGGLATVDGAVRECVRGLGGVYVGRVAAAGICRFTAHVSAEPATPVVVTGSPAARVRTQYDPHWAYVRNTLAPDERQHQLLTDRAVLAVLTEHGDVLSTPRDVAHVALFAEVASAEQAATALRADGYTATVERDDEGEFELTALRTDPVAPPAVHELSWRVKEIVERHGGSYDGWTCEVTSGTRGAAANAA